MISLNNYTALEWIGLGAILTITWFVFKETWRFLYTTFLGHALGRSISLRNIGQWAGKRLSWWRHVCQKQNTSCWAGCLNFSDKMFVFSFSFDLVVTGATDGIGNRTHFHFNLKILKLNCPFNLTHSVWLQAERTQKRYVYYCALAVFDVFF